MVLSVKDKETTRSPIFTKGAQVGAIPKKIPKVLQTNVRGKDLDLKIFAKSVFEGPASMSLKADEYRAMLERLKYVLQVPTLIEVRAILGITWQSITWMNDTEGKMTYQVPLILPLIMLMRYRVDPDWLFGKSNMPFAVPSEKHYTEEELNTIASKVYMYMVNNPSIAQKVMEGDRKLRLRRGGDLILFNAEFIKTVTPVEKVIIYRYNAKEVDKLLDTVFALYEKKPKGTKQKN